ncbi:proprotein convertase subtilisin/kexin type 7 isoform X1 [Neolamprologus brichardi]|uniref:proprotein convertase subtilisin/kexin type 7 isoform X1 n=1 Tax=Neolamprologus brichardi TaxID=32507 RepID=UPI0003EC3F9D|nr:proprotein convertase subtilisin/kexin type 7 isoform X1 [Neolamprologus brichardi]XP_006801173.1 proprotein convertase subtilisin/kexin type 7 isoform X1 [Neolamprologus brichardi]XP_006801174.1 proprotein convertase subtilisin/kexin type 7 isoform X1 [Neolamprologus brichardi]XP_006801175.1 proprotein convertase subtilisin/kexin type 7 isoform X1 [Neolamprologus brichardi]XP_035768094.1 proprotein convertase subtilisin/kexin type 7 isoform X1 [Neolamprologus brichardi]
MAKLYLPTFLLLIFLSSFVLLLLILLTPVTPSLPLAPASDPSLWPSPSCSPGQSWAVRLHTGLDHKEEDGEHGAVHMDFIANKVAEQAGLHNHGQIGHLEGHYLLCSTKPGARSVGRIKRQALRPEDVLAGHPHVMWYSQERVLSRSKRSMAFNDPNYPKQWHLHNAVSKGMDINVTGVWERNITGQGVTVVVVDDGVEHTHQDIQPNYSPEGSYDLNSNDPDPMPHPDSHSDNHHGTRCAGEIAAVPNNSFCAVGVAYGSKVAGIRVLDGPLTDSLEAIAFNKHYQVNDIYSCSWGPDDDGHTVDGPHPLGKAALQHGVIAGRRGFGSIFIVASGNGGQYNDNCNYDGYANSIYTITIGAVDEKGKMPFYAEECASMLAVTFSSGRGSLRSIVTSDWSMQGGTGCTEGHTGTSAAAPLAAGMVALMLQVRPCLTWRDIQHIITFTATKCDSSADWKVNGAGFHHSHQHGFGLLNAWRLVNAAKAWESVPFLLSYQSSVIKEETPIVIYPDELVLTWEVSAADLRQSGMETLEHVAVTVTVIHPCRGNVEFVLICPSGMTSVIGARRAIDRDNAGYQDWTFSTVRCWGERAQGLYTLKISDHKDESSVQCAAVGVLKERKLTLYGSSMMFSEVKERQRLVEEAMTGKYLHSNFSLPCPPGLDLPPEITKPFTSNNLKFMLLLGCFALFWSLYYTLEVMMAHVDFRVLLCLPRRQGGHRRGRQGKGVEEALIGDEDGEDEEQDSGVELQAVLDSDVKEPLASGEWLAT